MAVPLTVMTTVAFPSRRARVGYSLAASLAPALNLRSLAEDTVGLAVAEALGAGEAMDDAAGEAMDDAGDPAFALEVSFCVQPVVVMSAIARVAISQMRS